MRETMVVGAVGAGGLGLPLARQLVRFDFDGASTTVRATIALAFAVDLSAPRCAVGCAQACGGIGRPAVALSGC